MDRLVPHFELKKICTNALMSAGISGQSAEIVADNLVDANLRGIDSHGVMRLPFYIRGLQEGLINPNPTVRINSTEIGINKVISNDFGALPAYSRRHQGIG